MGNAPVEGGAIELRENVDLADARIDAIAHRHINQAVCTPDRHRRLGASLGEWVQPGACSSTQDDCCREAKLRN